MSNPNNPTDSDTNVSVVERISAALETAGINATPALYDEAVKLARDGLLGTAHDRLRMLLCLDPENGRARLLLARVFVGQERWTDARQQLDVAENLGQVVPRALQSRVEAGLEAERNAVEQAAERIAATERKELRALRAEASKLRTEGSRTEQTLKKLRVKFYATLAFAMATLAGTIIPTFLAVLLKSDLNESEKVAGQLKEQASGFEVKLDVAKKEAVEEYQRQAQAAAVDKAEAQAAEIPSCLTDSSVVTDFGDGYVGVFCFDPVVGLMVRACPVSPEAAEFDERDQSCRTAVVVKTPQQ